jgi:hypothetical protein
VVVIYKNLSGEELTVIELRGGQRLPSQRRIGRILNGYS